MAHNLLNGYAVTFDGFPRQVFQWPTVMAGVTESNAIALLKVDATGQLLTASGSVSVTPVIYNISAGETYTIPTGAKGWGYAVLTGTATVNGVSVQAGFSDSDPDTLLEDIEITAGADSSVYVRHNT